VGVHKKSKPAPIQKMKTHVDGSPVSTDVRHTPWITALEDIKKNHPQKWRELAAYNGEKTSAAMVSRLKHMQYRIWPTGVWWLKSRQRWENGQIVGSAIDVCFVRNSETVQFVKGSRGVVRPGDVPPPSGAELREVAEVSPLVPDDGTDDDGTEAANTKPAPPHNPDWEDDLPD
jgi:hypothetical protein